MKTNPNVIKCGNCHYWTGLREPVLDNHGQEKVVIHDDTGECERSESKFFGQDRKKNAKCKEFYKWTELM